MWLKDKEDPLHPKGNGKGIMISDFLTPNGRLQAPSQITEDILMAHNVPREATTFFEYGKNSYWTGERMAAQTMDVAVPLFEVVFPRNKFQGLFLFDNATNHRAMAQDALDVTKMNLKRGEKSARMRSTWNTFTQEVQQMVFPDGTPKRIRQVLIERDKWSPEGLHLDCKPVSEHKKDNNCCAKKFLAAELDFQKQVGLIQEKKLRPGAILLCSIPSFVLRSILLSIFGGHVSDSLVGIATAPWMAFGQQNLVRYNPSRYQQSENSTNEPCESWRRIDGAFLLVQKSTEIRFTSHIVEFKSSPILSFRHE